jgi:hypothetical protein
MYFCKIVRLFNLWLLQTYQVTYMVMSEEPDMVEKEVDIVSERNGKDKERVSDKEKDLAVETSSAFNSVDYTRCLTTLELEVS